MHIFGVPIFPDQASTFAKDVDALYFFILTVCASFALAVAVAVAAAAPWLALWPALLYLQSPVLFNEWLWDANMARFVGGHPESGLLYYLRILPWYAWPVWPIALWTLWRARVSGFDKPAVAMPVFGFIVTVALLSVLPDVRELYALPMLIPLTLLATPVADTLRRGAANQPAFKCCEIATNTSRNMSAVRRLVWVL